MTFEAKNYKDRADLDAVIQAEVGTNTRENLNSSYIISGTRAELKKLHLTDASTVFGVRCVITDTPTKSEVEIEDSATISKPDRNFEKNRD